MKKLLCVLFIVLMFSACEESPEEIAKGKQVGELRHKLFVECMELAAKMPRQSNDNVSKIIDQCSNQSYYMANHISY